MSEAKYSVWVDVENHTIRQAIEAYLRVVFVRVSFASAFELCGADGAPHLIITDSPKGRQNEMLFPGWVTPQYPELWNQHGLRLLQEIRRQLNDDRLFVFNGP